LRWRGGQYLDSLERVSQEMEVLLYFFATIGDVAVHTGISRMPWGSRTVQ
jgi:hypothetical protein